MSSGNLCLINHLILFWPQAASTVPDKECQNSKWFLLNFCLNFAYFFSWYWAYMTQYSYITLIITDGAVVTSFCKVNQVCTFISNKSMQKINPKYGLNLLSNHCFRIWNCQVRTLAQTQVRSFYLIPNYRKQARSFAQKVDRNKAIMITEAKFIW